MIRELSTQQSAPSKQVQQTILNYLLKTAYSNREIYKEHPTDPILGTWVSYNDWQKLKLKEWKFERRKTPISDIEINVRRYSVEEVTKIEGFDSGDAKAKLVELLAQVIKPLGWFVRRIDFNRYLSTYTLYLGPLQYKQLEIKRYLYHFSMIDNKERILRKGLIPKKGSYGTDFMYPARVHLLTKLDMDYIQQLAFTIFTHGTFSGPEDEYYSKKEIPPIVIFKIDTTKLRPNTKFYRDPLVKDGAWTYTHIPPQALSVKYEDTIPEGYFE